MENNTSNANHSQDEKGNDCGLSDETLKIHPGLELECSICLDTIFRPHLLAGCNHIFCEPCIISLFRATINTVSGPRCPLCRADITETYLLREVDETLMKYFEEKCQNRLEMETEVYHSCNLEAQDLMDLDFREDLAGFEVYRSQDGGFNVRDRVFVDDFDQNSKNERNLYLKAVLSSLQH